MSTLRGFRRGGWTEFGGCEIVLFGQSLFLVIDRGCILLSELSASRTRKSRACWSVDRDSLMRATASLSGVMLKFPIVWWMSFAMLERQESG